MQRYIRNMFFAVAAKEFCLKSVNFDGLKRGDYQIPSFSTTLFFPFNKFTHVSDRDVSLVHATAARRTRSYSFFFAGTMTVSSGFSLRFFCKTARSALSAKSARFIKSSRQLPFGTERGPADLTAPFKCTWII